jgi:hypothetical protein
MIVCNLIVPFGKLSVGTPILASQSCHADSYSVVRNVTAVACNWPIRDHRKIIWTNGVSLGALALVVFLMRMAARSHYFGGTVGMDDWIMVISMVCTFYANALWSSANWRVSDTCSDSGCFDRTLYVTWPLFHVSQTSPN